MKNKAVILDLDDTLFPESSYVRSGFLAVAEWGESELRIAQSESAVYLNEAFESGIRANTFNMWLKHFGLDASTILVQQIVDVYRNHEPDISPFDEVPSILRKLSKSYALGLVSDGYLEVQKKKFAALQLSHYFDAICFSDELGREHWKPSPRPFQVVAERLQVPAADCVYVGDNPNKDFLVTQCRHAFHPTPT